MFDPAATCPQRCQNGMYVSFFSAKGRLQSLREYPAETNPTCPLAEHTYRENMSLIVLQPAKHLEYIKLFKVVFWCSRCGSEQDKIQHSMGSTHFLF